MASRLFVLPLCAVALCLSATAQPSTEEPFGIGGAPVGGGLPQGGSFGIGGAGGIGIGGALLTGGTSGVGAQDAGGEATTGGSPGTGAGSVAVPVGAGAGGFPGNSGRAIDGCSCRTVQGGAPSVLWTLCTLALLLARRPPRVRPRPRK